MMTLKNYGTILQCDLGVGTIVFRLIGKNYRDNKADIIIKQTIDLLSLRASVFSGKCNPAIFADIIEENKEQWVYAINPQLLLNVLRGYWR